jgi:ankyrin repeat protein
LSYPIVIEVGIYNVSNNLHYKYGLDPFIETLLQSISWAVLRPLLSLPVISIQAFTESVFLHAVTTQRLQVVEDLLRYDWIRATVVSNGLALVSAVRTSSCKLVSLMLRAGASPNKTALRDAVPLTEAKDIHVAKLLLEAGADINADHGRYSAPIRTSTIGPALLAATAARNIDLVRYLIEKGADVNSHGKLFSATMLAVQGGNIDILHLLLVSGALPNEAVHTTSSIRTPLQKAAELGDIQAVQLLIRFGANVNASAFGNSGKTALQAAVSRADVEMTELFLKNGADVNVLIKSDAKFPRSPLTVAVELNKPDLVKVILDAGADINILSYGYYGCTALESAMHLPDGSNVQNLLIARGAQHNAQFNNEHCQIQLRKAVWAADLARVKALLETGFKIDMQPFEDGPNDDYGRVREQIPRSILQDAIVAGTAMFQLLFEVIKGYDDDIDYHPILVEAIRAKKLEIQTTLLAAGAKVNSTHCHTGRMIGTPLMFAVWENDLESVRYLYHNGADINIVAEGFVLDIFGDASTALQISVWRSTQSLRQNCVSDILHFLRQHGATINAPIARNRGFSELARAAKAGMLTLVQELLDSGAKVNSLPAEIGGMTALQAAAGSHTARNDIVELLLQSGADVNAPTACQGGITALGAAAKQGHFQIALILLKAGADVNSEFIEYTRVPSTALIVAAREGRLDIVHLLLKAGADLHLPKEKRYIQAIEDAKRRGHIALATVLEGYCTVV